MISQKVQLKTFMCTQETRFFECSHLFNQSLLKILTTTTKYERQLRSWKKIINHLALKTIQGLWFDPFWSLVLHLPSSQRVLFKKQEYRTCTWKVWWLLSSLGDLSLLIDLRVYKSALCLLGLKTQCQKTHLQ